MELVAREAYKLKAEINENLDKTGSPHIANIREVINAMHFADITSKQQTLSNKGDAFYKFDYQEDFGDYMYNLGLKYVIYPKKLGLVYGTIYEKTDKDGNSVANYKSLAFNNYARFIADIVANKVIYSESLGHFIIIESHSYTAIQNETDFDMYYPVDKKQKINDFLNVFVDIYDNYIKQKHPYKINIQQIAGIDWRLDCNNNKLTYDEPEENELFFEFYEIASYQLDLKKATDFIDLIAANNNSNHNLKLLHAYVMKRKMKLIPAEKWFIFKDFGRTGKGLFISTFSSIMKKHSVEFENLLGGGFEASNEWANFYNADVIHANETGEITNKQMKEIRKISTGETVTARKIGRDAFTFKIEGVFILDTNNMVDIGDLKADTARTVKVSLKDRNKETESERKRIFKPYWEFMTENGDQTKGKQEAALSFLINSFLYLNICENQFNFENTNFKNYYNAEQLTDTQKMLLTVIYKQGFILSGDELLQSLIKEDYGTLKTAEGQKAMKSIGISINKQKKIEGANCKVNTVGNEELFNNAVKLLLESMD